MSIVIDKGLYTSIKITISDDVDFTNIKSIIFTLKNHKEDKPILIYEIQGVGEHILEITPEQSKLIKSCVLYDFDLITIDNKRYKITENDSIYLREGVGCTDD